MKEIGGYIELDSYRGKLLHDDGIKLNCGRCALDYAIKSKGIKKLYVPKLMCDSNDRILKDNAVSIEYFSVGMDFKPLLMERKKDEWLYLVNYYGQLSNEFIMTLGDNVIVDNAQAYFQDNIENYITIYTCRKFFGVADGAILYNDVMLDGLEQDISCGRMKFLLGRYEKKASEFYEDYVNNNDFFNNVSTKKMSRLTENLLRGIDYEFAKNRRTDNFTYLHERFENINKLKIKVPQGAFMYPLYIENGAMIRKRLWKSKIYIPLLWPHVFEICKKNEIEYDMAENILPLPVDQRYDKEDMRYLVEVIERYVLSERT